MARSEEMTALLDIFIRSGIILRITE